jgi:YD repeat-containing protein
MIAARTPGADIVLERDLLGRVVKEHAAIHATATRAEIASRYDAGGLRVERTSSLAHRTAYAYNQAGDLTSVEAGWALGAGAATLRGLGLPQAMQHDFAIKIARDALGQELARRLPGGVAAVWSRDRLGRPTEQRVLTGASRESPGRDVPRPATRGARPTSSPRHRPRPTTGAAQEARASSMTGAATRPADVFERGLERQSDPVATSSDADRRVRRPGGPPSADGTTSRSTPTLPHRDPSDGAVWRYVWAPRQLTDVLRPDGKTVTFTYDAFGRRTTKTFDRKTTEYVWDGDDLVHERVRDADGAASPVTTWVFEPGAFTPLAKIEGRKRYGIVTVLGTPACHHGSGRSPAPSSMCTASSGTTTSPRARRSRGRRQDQQPGATRAVRGRRDRALLQPVSVLRRDGEVSEQDRMACWKVQRCIHTRIISS